MIAKQTLTPADVTEILQLAARCDRHDNSHVRLNEDFLQLRKETETSDFFWYENGELVGFLGLYQFNNHEIEASGMVHPEHRRKGIFSALVEALKQEVKRRGVSTIVFFNERISTTGAAFLQQQGAAYSFSEYWMVLGEPVAPPSVHGITIREATEQDASEVARCLADAFDRDYEETLASVKGGNDRQDRERFVIQHQGTTVGTIALIRLADGPCTIVGFCIAPALQGKGYGREALAQTISAALDSGATDVNLEVAVQNANALRLYQTCGFAVTSAYDYYTLQL